MTTIESLYKDLGADLPSFHELNEEFELSEIEPNEFFLKNTIRKISEKYEFYIHLLSELLSPDAGSVSSMHETRFFSEEEKEKMYALFKHLMKSQRTMLELVLGKGKHDQVQFLKEFYPEWKESKKQLLTIIEKMKDSWNNVTLKEQEVGYFG